MATYRENSEQTPLEHWFEYDRQQSAATFHGSETYNWFRDNGYLMIGESVVRLCIGSGGADQHYWVSDDYKLEGMALPMHSGEKGVFEPSEKMDGEGDPDWSLGGVALAEADIRNLILGDSEEDKRLS